MTLPYIKKLLFSYEEKYMNDEISDTVFKSVMDTMLIFLSDYYNDDIHRILTDECFNYVESLLDDLESQKRIEVTCDVTTMIEIEIEKEIEDSKICADYILEKRFSYFNGRKDYY